MTNLMVGSVGISRKWCYSSSKNSVFIVNMAKNDQKSGQNGPKMASNGQSDSKIKFYAYNYIRKRSQMLLLNKMLQNVLFGRVLAFCHTLGEVRSALFLYHPLLT